MTVPVYIAECAPAHMRGRLVALNNASITCGQFIASVICGAFSYDKRNGWRFETYLISIQFGKIYNMHIFDSFLENLLFCFDLFTYQTLAVQSSWSFISKIHTHSKKVEQKVQANI